MPLKDRSTTIENGHQAGVLGRGRQYPPDVTGRLDACQRDRRCVGPDGAAPVDANGAWSTIRLLCVLGLGLVATGCLGDDFAAVTVVNSCERSVQVAVSDSSLGDSDVEWTRLAPDASHEFSAAGLPDTPLYLEIRDAEPEADSRSTFVQTSDDSKVRLQNSICPR